MSIDSMMNNSADATMSLVILILAVTSILFLLSVLFRLVMTPPRISKNYRIDSGTSHSSKPKPKIEVKQVIATVSDAKVEPLTRTVMIINGKVVDPDEIVQVNNASSGSYEQPLRLQHMKSETGNEAMPA